LVRGGILAGTVRLGWGSAAFAACLIWPLSGYAQVSRSTGEPRVVEVQVEPGQPLFGRAFELRATLRIPPGSLAFFPDTLTSVYAVESLGPGRWSSVPGPADSIDLRAVYPVIGLREGLSDLPVLETWMSVDSVPDRPAQDIARSLAELGDNPEGRAQSFLLQLGTVTVVSVLPADTAELEPRPPADVRGGVWNAWLLFAALLIAAAGIVGTRMRARRLRAGDGSGLPVAVPHRSPTVEALRELDRIRAQGWHRKGQMLEFYSASTEALRLFARETEPRWGKALTSRELLDRMERRWAPGRVAALSEAVMVAERVKFGDHRPDAEAAERDWLKIREWIGSVSSG
jgi:hypothetical protein